MDIRKIYALARYTSFDEFHHRIKEHITGKLPTVEIPGEVDIEFKLILPDKKPLPSGFKHFDTIRKMFNPNFYNKTSWIKCYDKLIRIDGFSEEDVLKIVTHFRKEGNWWRDSGNFETLLKLRRLNPEKVKYIHVLAEKMKKANECTYAGFPTGNIIQKEDGKQRDY